LATLPQHVAEVDDAVAELQTLGKAAMQRRKLLGLAMNGGDGPDPAGPPQYRID